MNEYLFRIGDESQVCIFFKVIARTAEEAVGIANEALAEERGADDFCLRLRLRSSAVYVDSSVRVDQTMIIEVKPAQRDPLLAAYRFLAEQGYEYSDGEEGLWHDDQPEFTKVIYTEDGKGIYAFLKVTASFNLNIGAHSFRIGAVLYPVAMARIADGDGGLRYNVQFHDGQLYTTLSELPVTLAFYESKFLSLIMALRQADPLDGLPLEE